MTTAEKAKHTPGPWRVVPQAGEYFYEIRGGTVKDSILIAEISDICERDENARLIAAAPDMLAALEAILPTTKSDEWLLTYHDLARVRAAIRKARGE